MLPATFFSAQESAPLLARTAHTARPRGLFAGHWLVACERCGIDRRLPGDLPLPQGYWYCEWNPDPNAERCTPTADVPLRTSKSVKRAAGAAPAMAVMPDAHAQEMLDAFPRLKREAVEQELTLSSGWVAVFKRRKKGEGGDVYMTRPGEAALRSVADIRRRLGLAQTERGTAEDEATGQS